jgi:hypothetical protein
MAGRRKLHDATVASQKKDPKNPNREGDCTVPFHSLATTAGRGEDNSSKSPPTPEAPRQSRKKKSVITIEHFKVYLKIILQYKILQYLLEILLTEYIFSMGGE